MVPTHCLRARSSEYLRYSANALMFLTLAVGALELAVCDSTQPVGIYNYLTIAITALFFTGLGLRHMARQELLLSGTFLRYRDRQGERIIERCDICFCRLSLASKASVPGETRIQILAKNPDTLPIYLPIRLFFRPEMLRWIDGIPMDRALGGEIRARTAIRAPAGYKPAFPF